MRSAIIASALLCTIPVMAQGPQLLDGMEDANQYRLPKEKGKLEQVPGHDGKALQFSYDDGCQSTFFIGRVRGTPAWDHAHGISFWVKGDGSNHLGGVQFIFDNNYALRYDCAFPISGTQWQKVTIPWRDLIPVTPKPSSVPLDPAGSNPPSKLTSMMIGKWWYWRDYAAHSFALDQLQLEPSIELDTQDYRPQGAPLARVAAKLKAGQPVTIVTMGDSLTDFKHWANREQNWPTLLSKMVEEKHKSKVTLVNPAIGGTELRQNLVLIPRWLAEASEPDLVTICFGFNDYSSGMRGEMFLATYRDAVDRIRRATHGKSDILIITTCPAATRWTEMAELADACRKAAAEKNTGLADIYQAFHQAGQENKERLYVRDKTHLSPAGHTIVAEQVLKAIAGN